MMLTGAYPDRESSRDRDRVDFNFANVPARPDIASYATGDEFVQPIAWIRSQPRFPDCVGETFAAGIESKLLPTSVASAMSATATSRFTRVSAVSIWREARRRQGLIELIEIGTRLEYAIDGLVSRGWDPYRDGEEYDEEEAGKGATPAGDDLADEMFAYDKRLAKSVRRYRIIGLGSGVLDAVDEALRRDYVVGQGTGILPPFFEHVGYQDKPDVVLGLAHMSGSKDRHATRIAGRATYNGRRMYLVQNSHGTGWGGCHLPDGSWQPGCAWVDEDVIVSANDIHVVDVSQ